MISKVDSFLDIVKKFINEKNLLKNSPVIVTEVAEWLEKGEDGKPTGNVLGSEFECVCPALSYARIILRISSESQILTAEQIEKNGGEIKATPVNLKVNFYKIGAGVGMSIKADDLILETEENLFA